MPQLDFAAKTHYLFDLDGTLYRGSEPIPGACETVAFLRDCGLQVRFLSNNSNEACQAIAKRLSSMRIEANAREIYTPLRFAGAFLRARFGLCHVYVVGSEALCQAVQGGGHKVAQLGAHPLPDTVLVGRDLAFGYDAMTYAGRCLQAGARFVVANADLTHPGAQGYDVPETGAFAAALQCLAPAARPVYIGKPEPYLFEYVFSAEKVLPTRAVMIGDNPRTDILGGRSAGMDTVWLRLGGTVSTSGATLEMADMRDLLAQLKKVLLCG